MSKSSAIAIAVIAIVTNWSASSPASAYSVTGDVVTRGDLNHATEGGGFLNARVRATPVISILPYPPALLETVSPRNGRSHQDPASSDKAPRRPVIRDVHPELKASPVNA